MNIFELPCSCGKHVFVFGEKPDQVVEVKCPECEQTLTYDPAQREVNKEVDTNAGKTKQEQ